MKHSPIVVKLTQAEAYALRKALFRFKWSGGHVNWRQQPAFDRAIAKVETAVATKGCYRKPRRLYQHNTNGQPQTP